LPEVEAVQDNGAIFKAAFERSPIPQAVTNAQGMPLAWNAAFESAFERVAGFEVAKLASPLFELLEAKEAFGLSYYVSELLHGRMGSVSFELPLSGRDAKLWFRIAVALIPSRPDEEGDEDERSGGRMILLSLEEVTDQKRRERNLVDAKEEAERATVTKSRFVANMSHEIRTPIQTIIGMGELLADTELDEEQKEYQAQIAFSAEVLLALVNDVLDWSKMEAGKFELDSSDFDLRKCAEQAMSMLALDAHRKGLETLLDIAADVPRVVRGDPARVRQVIVNLVKNAVKFTDSGYVSLAVTAVGRPGRKMLHLEVADSGPGVPPSERGRLFTPFFQADAAGTTKSQGTGLGLAICRSLAEMMRGSIRYEPLARGSLFTFEFPLEEAAFEVPSPILALSRPLRVVVVDDHPAARSLAVRMVRSFGAECDSCAGGEEAIGLAKSILARGDRAPDVILVDEGMHGMDGWRFASEIKGLNLDPALVLMIPEGARYREAKMKRLGWFHAYVVKPLREESLFAAINSSLAARDDGLLALEEDRDDAGSAKGRRVEGTPPQEGLAPSSAKEERTEERKPPEHADAGRGANARDGKVPRLLVAEDHDVNRELFALFIGRLGYKADLVTDGEQAVARARNEYYDAILLDLFMPKLDGLSAARAIREHGFAGPVIAVTASVQKEDKDRCLAAGMNDVLRKPFKLGDLDAMLAYWLSRKPQEKERATTRVDEGKHLWDREVFDFTEALETFLGNRDTLIGLLERFEERTRGQLAQAAKAIDSGDNDEARAIAHTIKGSSWNLSAKKLGDRALALEEECKDGDSGGRRAALDALEEAFAEYAECAAYYRELFY
jgi:signal transduction histidine kinase/DNA-binding response OmpR family regulator